MGIEDALYHYKRCALDANKGESPGECEACQSCPLSKPIHEHSEHPIFCEIMGDIDRHFADYRMIQTLSRYQCIECWQEETGETDCLKHAVKYGHKAFLDREGLGNAELKAHGITVYFPLDDPDILDEQE